MEKKVIILLDEYDTPMQEAYVNGYWDELAGFIRSLFNSTFKTNPYLERGMMIGILTNFEMDAPLPLGSTRPRQVDKVGFPAKFEKTSLSSQCQSIFSDLNNLKVITATSKEYTDCFGFTEEEVFAALDEFNLSDGKQEVKRWYDGFTFGKSADIYNPWSIINYLDTKKFDTYWANTSSNNLVGKQLRESSADTKQIFERLLEGEELVTEIDEQIVYNLLGQDEQAIWALLLASGYLKVNRYGIVTDEYGGWKKEYALELTNFEVKVMFRNMIQRWFGPVSADYNGFIKALLLGDVDAMNDYMNEISQSVFSCFDTGKNPSKKEPERFYHGFVLGLMVELRGRYVLTSNRESGFGRYDIMLEPINASDDAIILEFKVFQNRKEREILDTVKAALEQIEDKKYESALIAKGISKERIRKYGFAFCGKEVLIGC